jgi:hypothetical protein
MSELSQWLLDLTKPIKIEVGKTYDVNPCYKKSVVETMFYRKGKDQVSISSTWRSGSFRITVVDEDERDALDHYQTNAGFEPYSFEDNEFLETWDECSCDWEFFGETLNEDYDRQEKIQEGYWEDGFCYFDDNGWEELDPEIYFDVPILCTEATPGEY